MKFDSKIYGEYKLLGEAGKYDALATWYTVAEGQKERIEKVMIFCHTVLPHYFTAASPKFHREIVRRFFSEHDEYMAAPRGFSKTTLLQGCMIYSIVAKLDKFIVLIEKTFDEASNVLKAVRDEFADNEMILGLWGDMINRESEEEDKAVAKQSKNRDAWGDTFINGVRLRGVGFNKTVRGLKTRQYRPSRIVMDDVEEDEHIDQKGQRQKGEKNYTKAVIPSTKRGGSIKVFGTILHHDSLLNNLIKQHNGIIYKAFYTPEMDENYASIKLPEVKLTEGQMTSFANDKVKLLWGDYWDWDHLMNLRDKMSLEGASNNAFFQELRNEPTAEEERKFKHAWLWNKDRRMEVSELLDSGKELAGYAMFDLGESTRDKADPTAAVVILVDTDGNWYRVDVRNERRNINDQINLIFEIWQKWFKHGLVSIGVEKKAFDDQVRPLLEEEMDRRDMYPVVEELEPMGRNKINRIVGALQGRYERGKIWTMLNSQGQPVGATNELLHQLYDLGKSKHDDLADAEAYGADLISRPVTEESTSYENEPIDDPYAVQVVSI